MVRLIKYISLVSIVIFIIACSGTKNSTTPRNLEMIYDPLSSSLHPNFQVYNIFEDESLLAGKILANELLYNSANNNKLLTSRIKIQYNLYDLDSKDRLVDSLTSFFSFEKAKRDKYHYIEIPLKTKIGRKYILEVITIDQNRNNRQYSILKIDRTQKVTQQNFLVKDTLEVEFNVNPDFYINSKFSLEHYNSKIDSFNVFYFKKFEQTPFPANVKDTVLYNFVDPDTSWVCNIDSMDYENYISEGVYYFTTNDVPVNGVAIKQFGEDFPVVKTPQDLINPLAYFDFKDTISYNDSLGKLTKLYVDNFWLAKVNNIERSRDLIKLFYNRVESANRYFSSFVEGWQTDRGMIYIVYGLPDYIFKSDDEEKWIYSPIDLGPGLSFTFEYYENPFSLNHYILKRDRLKDSGWNAAIKLWENGEVIYYQK